MSKTIPSSWEQFDIWVKEGRYGDLMTVGFDIEAYEAAQAQLVASLGHRLPNDAVQLQQWVETGLYGDPQSKLFDTEAYEVAKASLYR